MGARFDQWLARPTTLHFLRQLIGREPAAIRTKRPHWNTLHKRHIRCYSAAQPAIATSTWDDRTSNTAAAAAASIETFHEQRERVAQELGLHILRKDDDDRVHHQLGPMPSSTSYSDLLYSEARVRDFSTARGLLIDEPVNHANLGAWCKILEYRQRTDGFAGVVDVWEGMRKRGINLPVDGSHADTLWTTFLYAAIAPDQNDLRNRLLKELWTHAKDLKASGHGHYRSFHNIIVGRFLRLVPGGARKRSRSKTPDREHKLHQSACELGFCEAQALPFLVMDVLKSTKPRLSFARWQKLYLHDKQYYNNDRHGMYDLCMPLVLLHATDDAALVISWHNFFVSHNDMPSPELANNRSVRYLLGSDSTLETDALASHIQLKELTAILAEDRGDAQPSTSPILSRASMSGLLGEVHGIKPKAISDKFCARMFATRAFSLETSIRGLALLGTESLGPIALRELAIRANTPEILKERLADVKQAGIAISPSAYAYILKTVVANSQIDLFQTLLASDQHPESYDDQHTQETLLTNFLQEEDLPSAHLTLIGLSGVSQADPSKASRAWNRLLQHYTKAQNYKESARIFNHLCSEQLIVTSRSLNFMLKYLLPDRAPSKRPMLASDPQQNYPTCLNFVVNAHMYAASMGQVLKADRWIELLKRYGMTDNMDGVERLAPWLVQRYPKEPKSTEYVRRNNMLERFTADTSRQSMILNPIMLRAMVTWGFRHEGIHNRLRLPSEEPAMSVYETALTTSWTRGIALVSRLKAMGASVRTADVRRAVTGILWTLFGPGVSKRRVNLQLLRCNELTIMDYVKDANAAWHEPLFEIPSGSEDITTEAHVTRAVFGKQRLADQKTGDWVDVEAWAVAREQGLWQEPSPTLQDRHAAWSHSAFRFKDDFDTRRERQLANRRRDPFQSRDHSAQIHDVTTNSVSPPPSQQPAAQPSNWRPLPSQPDTPEEP
jgi:hypothetical protein